MKLTPEQAEKVLYSLHLDGFDAYADKNDDNVIYILVKTFKDVFHVSISEEEIKYRMFKIDYQLK